jgi:pimeloyl-ACP methyl ester carboxylesterase
MFGLKKRPLEKRQPTSESAWHVPQSHLDTVVFVHGILGRHGTTWGQFHHLLTTDSDLPRLDILSWGYKSGLVPNSYQDVETEGQALFSGLEMLVRPGRSIYLVGHSMGGLVILKGLVNRIINQQGKSHPVTSIQCIVLYASPLYGTHVASVVAAALGFGRWTRLLARFVAYKQLRDLRRGDFCDQLISDVTTHVYRPLATNLLARGPIRVRACAAKHDGLVSVKSAIAMFVDPPPHYLEGDHGSVKLPDHHSDHRYLALKNDLQECIKASFGELCRRVRKGMERADRLEAAERLELQYGEMIRRCAQACFSPRDITDEDLFEVAAMVYEVGAAGAASPAQVMTQVYRDYKFKDDPRFKR